MQLTDDNIQANGIVLLSKDPTLIMVCLMLMRTAHGATFTYFCGACCLFHTRYISIRKDTKDLSPCSCESSKTSSLWDLDCVGGREGKG